MGTEIDFVKNSNISGVVIEPLQQFADDRGKVMHMLKSTSPIYERFGEVYFSTINSGAIKAWKLHHKVTQYLAVPVGKVRVVIYDDRKNSPTQRDIKILEIGEDNYCLVKIPPLLWYGFKGISDCPSLIANCADFPHDSKEQEVADISDQRFPYKW